MRGQGQGEEMMINRAVELVEYVNEGEAWEGCRLVNRGMPCVKPGHVVVRVLCRTVNPVDKTCMQGLCSSWQPPSLPAVLGLEGMGVIYQIGEGVSAHLQVGQRVFPVVKNPEMSGQGLWQEYILVPADALVLIPPSVPDEVAAQFRLNPWTVIGMLEILQVPKGDYVLQTAAASVLGRMIIQYAHNQGIKTINVVRRKDQVEELKALGADEIIVSTHEDVLEKVKLITKGKMAHSALECVGGDMSNMVVKCVRDGSTVLIYGELGEEHAKLPISSLIFKDIKFKGFFLPIWIKSLPSRNVQEVSKLAMSLLEKKIITPFVGEKYPLQKFKEAIKKSLESGRGGKVLIVS